MEFKLNKIDTDIRKRIEEDRKISKVHSSESIQLRNDVQKDKRENHIDKEQIIKENKKFVTIDGVKYTDKQIKVEAEKTEKINVLNSSGRILDTKK